MARSIRDAIIEILRANSGDMALQDIYCGVYKIYNVSPYQQKPDPVYGRKRIEHEIRSIIAKLKKEGIVERPERGYYRIKQ